MKNFKSKVLQATLIIAVIFGISSCANNQPEDTKEIAEEKNEEKFENTSTEMDAEFLVDAAEISRQNISLGQLAQQKGNISHVVELGKMMETRHTQSLADLTALAATKNISLPISETESEQEAYKKLNEKSGNDFGKEYSDMMVNGHNDAIALFGKASTESSDPDIKSWAIATLPALRTHLEQSIACQTECAKM
jgi:putative membrane protein